ncbi:MAG TPA: hypothetical protein VGY54_13730 [Polyangiaceae bacterium]|jgi:hypothetical protein|nr:hypothetical protein [Polyangiaceae bacterium]
MMGAFASATIGWIAWGIMTPGDNFAKGSSWVEVTLLVMAFLGGYAAFKNGSRPVRIVTSLATGGSGLFWLGAPDAWWAKPPPRRPDGKASSIPAAEDPRAADSASMTTHTRSDSLPTPEERVSFLGRYLHLRSPLHDAAFVIDYHDNSTGLVPGPSDWRVWAGMQLPPGAMSSWLQETRPCEQKPDLELDAIVPATWKVSSEGRCLERGGTTLIAHTPEDILVVFAQTH